MSVETTRPRAAPLPPAERRAAIIRAVLPLLVERGSDATSRDIAAAAGVSEGTVFNAFSDKEELLAAVLEAALDPTEFEAAVAAIDRSQPFVVQLVTATALIQQRVVDVWGLVTRLETRRPAERRAMPESPAISSLLTDHAARVRVDARDAARLLRALTLSLSHPLLVEEARPPAEIVDLFLDGVAVRS